VKGWPVFNPDADFRRIAKRSQRRTVYGASEALPEDRMTATEQLSSNSVDDPQK